MAEVTLSSPTVPASRRLPIREFAYFSLATMLVLDALEGYAIAGVPLPWLGMALAIPVILVQATYQRLRAPPGVMLYLVLVVWLFANTMVASMLGPYAEMHPSTATTPYAGFVLLRGYSFLGYLLVLILVYNFAITDTRQRLVDFIVWLGVAVTLYAVYVFIAARVGLPVLPQSRYGTGEAGAQSGGAIGQFGDGNERFLVRVVGSFREPSFMAVWLIVPFFLSLTRGKGAMNWRTLVIAMGILGTGSLTTAVTLPIGFLLALVLMNPFRRQSLFILLGVTVGIGVLFLAIDLAFRLYLGFHQEFGLLTQFSDRLERITAGGVAASNRGYAYDKFFDSEFSLVGIGLGNAHIYYSRGAATPVSFLSLYIHIWFAAGAIGLGLLVLYILSPIALLMLRSGARTPDTVWLVATYLAWIIVYFGTAESFSMMPAMITGLLLAHLMRGAGPPRPA